MNRSLSDENKILKSALKTISLNTNNPTVILDTLNKINYDDILIYCDAGTYLNSNGIERFNEYISQLINTNKSLLVFSNNDSYKSQYYVKNDAIMSYYPEFNNKFDLICSFEISRNFT